MSKRRFSIQDIADTLDISRRTVRNHIKEGDLPAIKPGREYIVTWSDLIEWLGNEDRVRDLFGESGRDEQDSG
ncbi:helix-turn-helix domain-containing protein [Salinibacter ruber]|uniref:helix-turn-helix domain-containing protein n=1 Tax=Salinibacter ruber TaxID=146919 RepID=UPI0020747F14|nr:helix-turn-helix domain-containing protein [Salinibacter ruber]